MGKTTFSWSPRTAGYLRCLRKEGGGRGAGRIYCPPLRGQAAGGNAVVCYLWRMQRQIKVTEDGHFVQTSVIREAPGKALQALKIKEPKLLLSVKYNFIQGFLDTIAKNIQAPNFHSAMGKDWIPFRYRMLNSG